VQELKKGTILKDKEFGDRWEIIDFRKEERTLLFSIKRVNSIDNRLKYYLEHMLYDHFELVSKLEQVLK